jgi:hypothetical protein
MKQLAVVLALIMVVSSLHAKIGMRGKSSLIELGPKGSIYVGDDTRFGIGAEVVINPFRSTSLRLDLAEISFGDYTLFYLNSGLSLDFLIYIPMRSMQPYIHAGFGFVMLDTDAGSNTSFAIRGGMGFDFQMKPGAKLFLEPGLIISDNGDTDVIFRLSFGGRFGVF